MVFPQNGPRFQSIRAGDVLKIHLKYQSVRLQAVIVLSLVLALSSSLPSGPVLADMSGHGGMVRALDISNDGRRVLSGSFDFSARLWDFAGQTEIGVLDDHGGPVTDVAFVGDNQALTASDDMTAILWDLKTLKPIKRLKGHGHKVMGLAVSKDAKHAVTGSWDKTVRLWNLDQGKALRTFTNSSPVNAVVFTDGGKTIAAGGHNGKIHIWSAETGLSKGVLEGHELGITGLSVSPDGRRLLSSSIDKTLRLWDLETMTEIRVYKEHEAPIFAAAFSPDGKTALSAGRKGILIQWDLVKGNAIRTIRAIRDRRTIVWSVAFSPDGRFALTGSSDELIRVWHLESGDRIGLAAEGDNEPKPWLASNHPGARLFTKCARCHSLNAKGRGRSGPHLAGLFGRAAGSVEGYNYSSALTGVDFRWNEKTLYDLFDKGPDKYLPGTKMPVQRVPNTKQLTELVDYLKELTSVKGGN